MTTINTSSLLAMRTAILEKNDALQRAAGAGQATGIEGAEGGKGVGGFGDALRSALAEVNSLQAQSSAVAEAYEKGETTDIAAVMLSRQQASLGFEATLQVRNKLLAAYKDIMSMPV
ncbi:flagellar hook-basal body complex protein FliE [Allosphingosinicella humi]|jgi:flagellar hook-basal body complex protein FliE